MEDQRIRPYTRFQRKLDTLRNFPAVLEDYFNPYIKAAGFERTFDWSEVGRYYNNSQDTLSICYALKIFCEFVLKLFLRFDCGNERLIMLITYLYHRAKVRCHGNTEAIFCQDCEELNCRKMYHLNSQPLLKEVNEKTELVYNTQHFTKRSFYIYTRILSQYKEDDVYYYDFLQYLLKYGLFLIPNSEEAVTERFYFLRYVYSEVGQLPDRPQLDQILLNQLLLAVVNRNFRRLFMIIEVVSNYFMSDGKDQHARSFNLYSLTVPEPAISQEEVKEFIDISFANDERFKREAFRNFNNAFADSPKLPSPRSLKHLSRCKIRDCLPRSPPMPSVLHQIEHFPNCLKDYILFLTD